MKFRYLNRFGLIFAVLINLCTSLNKYQNISIMKKTLIIALCCLAVLFVACKKPVEPTPEPVDHTPNYVGNYIGQFTLTITSMNNQAQSSLSFPIDGIGMDITKGEEDNAITAMVTVGNESHYTNGTTSAEKAEFETVHLVIDEMHQISNPYLFNLDLLMEGTKANSDTLNIIGTFSGDGSASIMGQEQVFNEVSGTINGKLVKQ